MASLALLFVCLNNVKYWHRLWFCDGCCSMRWWREGHDLKFMFESNLFFQFHQKKDEWLWRADHRTCVLCCLSEQCLKVVEPSSRVYTHKHWKHDKLPTVTPLLQSFCGLSDKTWTFLYWSTYARGERKAFLWQTESLSRPRSSNFSDGCTVTVLWGVTWE